jgi:hypothetical protein
MILQFQTNVGVVPSSSSVHAYEMNRSGRKIPKNGTQHKCRMGDVCRAYLVTNIFYPNPRINTYNLSLDRRYIVVTFA